MSGGLLPKHVRCVREPCGNGDLTGVDATYATITPQVRPAVQSATVFTKGITVVSSKKSLNFEELMGGRCTSATGCHDIRNGDGACRRTGRS